MKNRDSRWARVLGLGVFGVLLLNVGARPVAAVGFPTAACRPGYIQAGPRMCISQFVQNAASFANAMVSCRNQRGRVASYGDLRYLYVNTSLDASYNPNGRWIGPELSADDQALCGNRDITSDNDADIGNFEGTCNRFDSRAYWCAHDDE